ncbi:MAG: exodeoxyribonuclease VII small subunit [Oscillospiraceae bacterium]|nr:exodeoxyribonuclease VII small subunit [Oscillospiraceae bacterium]
MENITYESAMKRLEEIVDRLESGSLPLDESLKYFEEGTRLVTYCNDCLNKAQQRITELSEEQESGIRDQELTGSQGLKVGN